MLKGDEGQVHVPGKFGRIDELSERKSALCGAAPWGMLLEAIANNKKYSLPQNRNRGSNLIKLFPIFFIENSVMC